LRFTPARQTVAQELEYPVDLEEPQESGDFEYHTPPVLEGAERIREAPAVSTPTRRRVYKTLTPPIDSRMVSLLPSLPEVSIKTFVEQVEVLFPIEKHRMLAVRAKLPEEYTYFLGSEENASWDATKSALLSRSKRATAATVMAYNRFTQNDNENITTAWERLLQLARAAEVRIDKMELWSYFTARLNQTSRLFFKTEIEMKDPYVALPRIAGVGDIPITPRPSLMVFQPQEDAAPRPPSKCWNCGKFGHIARKCRSPTVPGITKDNVPQNLPRDHTAPAPTTGAPAPVDQQQRDYSGSGRGGRRPRGNRRYQGGVGSEDYTTPVTRKEHTQATPTAPAVTERPRTTSSAVSVLTAFQPVGSATLPTTNSGS